MRDHRHPNIGNGDNVVVQHLEGIGVQVNEIAGHLQCDKVMPCALLAADLDPSANNPVHKQ